MQWSRAAVKSLQELQHSILLDCEFRKARSNQAGRLDDSLDTAIGLAVIFLGPVGRLSELLIDHLFFLQR